MIYVGFNHLQPKNKTCNLFEIELAYRKIKPLVYSPTAIIFVR